MYDLPIHTAINHHGDWDSILFTSASQAAILESNTLRNTEDVSHSFSRCIWGLFIQLAKVTNTNRKETQPLWSAIPLLLPVPYFPSVVPSHGWGGERARSVQGIIRNLLEAERNPFQHWIIDAPAWGVTCLHGVYRFQDTLFQNRAADGLLDHHIQGSRGYWNCYLHLHLVI